MFNEYEERFEEFLRIYKDIGDDSFKYFKRIQRMSLGGELALTVDFSDLTQFDSLFKVIAVENPRMLFGLANNALVNVLRIDDPDYADWVDPRDIKVRFINYDEQIPIRYIRSKHNGKLIQVTGFVESTEDVKLVLTMGVFQCRVCNEKIPQKQIHIIESGEQFPTYFEPVICPICGVKTPYRLVPEDSRFIDWQKVRIKEIPEQIPPDHSPISLDVVLKADLVGILEQGDTVSLTGILMPSPEIPLRSGRMTAFRLYLQVNGVRKINGGNP